MSRYRFEYEHNRSNFEKSKETNGFKGWRRAQYSAQSGRCAWCYKETAYKDMDVDHIMPLANSRFGNNLNDFDNLVLACHECNRDKKKDTLYNEIAYNNTLDKMSRQQKQDGYAPQKLYWERPSWIGANKYSYKYQDYIPVDISESKRNVWAQDAPLIRDYSLKIDDVTYLKDTINEKINDNSETIWKIVKWGVIAFVVFLLLCGINEIVSYQHPTSTKIEYCDYACQEAKYQQIEAEEERKRQKEQQEEYEEAKRYWECRNAGGSDYDCG